MHHQHVELGSAAWTTFSRIKIHIREAQIRQDRPGHMVLLVVKERRL